MLLALVASTAMWVGDSAYGQAKKTVGKDAAEGLALPVAPTKRPCVWLDAKPSEQKGQVPDNVPAAYGKLSEHNADAIRFSGNTIVLRKAGYAYQTATFRFKLPHAPKPGKYDVWTHFTLGGVAAQNFTISAGSGPETLERRARFRQSNGVSWKMSWRKGGEQFELRAEDRWIEIVVQGMATQQRQFTGFLLAFETDEARLRNAIGAMRTPNASRGFSVLEGENPDNVMTTLRYFAQRGDDMKNQVDVRLLQGKDAGDLANRAGAGQLPVLVASTRGLPRALLPLPATEEAVARFVETSRPSAVILECGAKGDSSPAAEDGQPILYGELIANNADRVQRSSNDVNLLKAGHAYSTGTLRYELTDQVKPGQYDVWTYFTLGGVAGQSFTVRAGAEPNRLATRTTFGQGNVASWQRHWQKGSRVTIYPQDRFLEIETRGMSSQQKVLDDFALILRQPLPEGVTAESGTWRAAVAGFESAAPKWRLRILEGDKATHADPFLRRLAEPSKTLKETSEAAILLGDQAEEFARELNVERLPALILMDDRYALRGVLTAPADETQVDAFLAKATADGPAPGPFPLRSRVKSDQPDPLQDGVPAAWLTVSGWAGPAGLSLWGIDAEARTRPNPGEPCAITGFDSNRLSVWAANAASDTGLVVIEPKSGDYTWARGAAYAHVYLDVEQDLECSLRLAHTGIAQQGWLDGEPLQFEKDASPPPAFSQVQTFQPSAGETAVGVTDQGGKISVQLGRSAAPQTALLQLKAGAHRLLIKLITRQPAGRTFALAARFTDADGNAPAGLRSQLSNPNCALQLQAEARRLTSRVTVHAPSNLPRPGQPLKLRYDLRHAGRAELPIVPFDARLVLEIADYDGKEIMRREVTRQFPGVVEFDLGKAPDCGYYAVQPTLYTPDGKLIMACVPDGFSVIGGTATQFARRDRKKMAVTYYFMGAGENATYRTAFPWMRRTGIYRNIGSSPSFPLELAEAAKREGIILTMDFWDIHNSRTQEARVDLAKKAAPYTPWYKSFNEVDIHHHVRKTPEHWVQRTKGEYEAVKAARPDAVFVGGSLVRPGSDDWFTTCLKQGLDRYVDAWDVHAYPQAPPTLEGTLSNSSNETELGVLTCYQRAGMTNTKPFWIGETGARASHGYDARRWQADTVAKMTACVCSRDDFQYIAFLWPWQAAHTGTHAGPKAGTNDITTPHMPGEAAYYTASALIDGFAYTRLDLGDNSVQAAFFGETRMLWSTSGRRQVNLTLDHGGPWVVVDVIGRVRALAVGEGGAARIDLTGSPVYVMSKASYERLTAFK